MFEKFHDASTRPIEPYVDAGMPVPIIQGAWEFQALLDIYWRLGPTRVMEVGSLLGGTLWHWIRLSPGGSRFVSVDMLTHPSDPRHGGQKAGHDGMWKSWAEMKSGTLDVVEGNSADPAIVEKTRALAGELDFLFIDGDHSYEGAKADFDNYGPLVRKGGVIAFHDILPARWWGSVEVHRLWDEIKAAGFVTQELYSRRDQHFLYERHSWGIGVVYV